MNSPRQNGISATLDLRYFGLVDDPHATTTQLFNHAVVGDGLAEYGSGIVHLRRMLGRAILQVNRGWLHAAARCFAITIYFWLRR